MTAQLAPRPVFRGWDNNANPLAGGQLFSYQGGTSTPQATYVDSTQTTQNTNPVILNARGEASVWLDPTKTYKLVLQDSLGNQIWSQDQIVGGYVPVSQLASYVTAAFIDQQLNPQTATELAAGLTPINFQYVQGQPERYMPANFTYAPSSSTPGSDFSGVINTLLAASINPILGPFNYTLNHTLNIPAASVIRGVGMWATNFIVNAATMTGQVMTETGNNAAKIVLENFGVYCNFASGLANAAIFLGYQNSLAPFGTNGFIDQVYVTQCPASPAVLAFDINCNAANIGVISANITAGIRIKGTGTQVMYLSTVGGSGFNDVNGNLTSCELYDVQCSCAEIEGTSTGVRLLTISGSADVVMYPSLVASYVGDYLVYLTNRVSSYRLHVPVVYYSGPSGFNGTFNNLIFDQTASIGFGAGNTSNTTQSQAMTGTYQYNSLLTGPASAIKKQTFNSFILRVVNTGGTLQHSMSATGNVGITGNMISSIPNASATLVNTPTGTDSSTAFANGGKISSASPSVFIFQSGAEIVNDFAAMAGSVVPVISGGTNSYSCQIFPSSFNVNGVTQNYMCCQLFNANTGAAVSWSTALGSSGNLIQLPIMGFFK